MKCLRVTLINIDCIVGWLLPLVRCWSRSETVSGLIWNGQVIAPDLILMRSTRVRHVNVPAVSSASAEEFAWVRMSSKELRMVRGLDGDGSLHVCSGVLYCSNGSPSTVCKSVRSMANIKLLQTSNGFLPLGAVDRKVSGDAESTEPIYRGIRRPQRT
jgi:hypothetical protein